MFAAPRGFSQLTASFVACRCQGIRRAPVYACPEELCSRPGIRCNLIPKLSKLSKNLPAGRKGRGNRVIPPGAARSCLVGVPGIEPGTSSLSGTRSNQLSYTPISWWRRPGSNRRHPACKAGALPTELRPRSGQPPRVAATRMFRKKSGGHFRSGRDATPVRPRRFRGHPFSPSRAALPRALLLRKEVIQPLVPQRLPCYDFIPITTHTFDGTVPRGLGLRLRVQTAFMM